MENEKKFLHSEINRLSYILYLNDEFGYVSDVIKIENISPRIDILKSILSFIEKSENNLKL